MNKKDEIAAEPVIKEVVLNAPVSKVWKAITDKDEMKQWYFDLKEFEAVPGFEFSFYGGTEERQYLHLCQVKEVIPQKKLVYSWRYDGFEGNSFVTFELFPEGGNTRLRLTHKGLETFPSDNPDFNKKNFEMGWKEITEKSIKQYLENA